MAEFDEAQAQQQLDELANHVEKAFLEYIGSLDSEPEEFDEASIDEVLDRVEKRYGGPGNSATSTADLTADLSVAALHAEGRTFQFGQIGTVCGIPGKVKIWGTLSGKLAYVIKSLPFGFFTIALTGTKGRLVFISTIRQKIKPGAGIGTWN